MKTLLFMLIYSRAKWEKFKKVLTYLMPYAAKGDYENYLADATIFMEMASNIIIGHQWLKMAIVAQKAMLNDEKVFETSFYESKIHTMKFYFKYELPKTKACLETIMHQDKLTLVDESKELIF